MNLIPNCSYFKFKYSMYHVTIYHVKTVIVHVIIRVTINELKQGAAFKHGSEVGRSLWLSHHVLMYH